MCGAGRLTRSSSSITCSKSVRSNMGKLIVDLGVGTGLSAEPFLRSGYSVIGVEPNEAMRLAGDQQLARVCG